MCSNFSSKAHRIGKIFFWQLNNNFIRIHCEKRIFTRSNQTSIFSQCILIKLLLSCQKNIFPIRCAFEEKLEHMELMRKDYGEHINLTKLNNLFFASLKSLGNFMMSY